MCLSGKCSLQTSACYYSSDTTLNFYQSCCYSQLINTRTVQFKRLCNLIRLIETLGKFFIQFSLINFLLSSMLLYPVWGRRGPEAYGRRLRVQDTPGQDANLL